MSAGVNSKIMNSLLPINAKSSTNTKLTNWFTPSTSSTNSGSGTSANSNTWIGLLVFLSGIAIIVGVMYYFRNQLTDTWNNSKEAILGFFGPKKQQPPPETGAGAGAGAGAGDKGPNEISNDETDLHSSANIVDKILPGGGNEVFNISSNKYTYYDAEPLCKALGAELATYDQVKDAWNKGADWCNYGWVKGQMAVYPTSEDTYKKIQASPEDQRMSCGNPGVNGGYFDNPEMRFGVTCVGQKPAQKKHDESEIAKGAPLSPDALAFDKKVNKFKSEADHIGINPFNTNKWTS